MGGPQKTFKKTTLSYFLFSPVSLVSVMATQQPSFLEPQPKYDPIIDKDKFEKELVSVSSPLELVYTDYLFRMTSLIRPCNLLKYLLKKNTSEVSL